MQTRLLDYIIHRTNWLIALLNSNDVNFLRKEGGGRKIFELKVLLASLNVGYIA